MSTPNPARDDAVHLLDHELQACLSDYVHPHPGGGYDTDSREAAEIVVDTLLATPDVLTALAASLTTSPLPAELSGREREVVALVAKGLPNKTIATRLDISRYTVSSYLRRVFAKLGVSSRAQMVAVAKDQGLLSGAQSAWAAGHAPGEPTADGSTTGMVWCSECRRLLCSDQRGLTRVATQPCPGPPLGAGDD